MSTEGRYYYWITSTRKSGNGKSAYEGLFEDTLDAFADLVENNEGNQSIKLTFMKIDKSKVTPSSRLWDIRSRSRSSRIHNLDKPKKEAIAKRLHAIWWKKSAIKRNYTRSYGSPRESTYDHMEGIELAEKLRKASNFVKKAWTNQATIN